MSLHLSTTALSIVLTIGGVLLYAAVALYGSWVDGQRQSVRDKGLHPFTDSSGNVHAQEDAQEEESEDVGKRS